MELFGLQTQCFSFTLIYWSRLLFHCLVTFEMIIKAEESLTLSVEIFAVIFHSLTVIYRKNTLCSLNGPAFQRHLCVMFIIFHTW